MNDLKLFIDFESTGLDVENDRIVEYALILKNGDEELCRASSIVNSDVPISEEASEVNGITQEQIDNAVTSQKHLAKLFASLLKMRPLIIGHNLGLFDYPLLYYTLCREFSETIAEKTLFPCKILDTLTVSKDRTFYPHKLGELVDRFNLDAVNSHKALDDVEALIALYNYMKKERDDLAKYVNLIGFYPKYGLAGKPLNTKKIVYLPQPFHQKRCTIGKTLYSSAKTLIKLLRGEI